MEKNGNMVSSIMFCFFFNWDINFRIGRKGENWTAIGYDECGKTHQSPIRLITSTAVINESLDITLENYNTPINAAFIENNGHTGILDDWFV